MTEMSEPYSDAEMLEMGREIMVRRARRSQSTEHSPDLKMMASHGLINWLIAEKDLYNLGEVYDYCMQMQTNPVGQAELLQLDMNDRRALAKVISMVDPVAGQPMMRFLQNTPSQNPDRPAV